MMSKPIRPQRWGTPDPQNPFFLGYRDLLGPLLDKPAWPALADLNDLAAQRCLTNEAGLPLRFTHQQTQQGQRAYEQQIQQTGEVPTRQASWHDFFNACVWLTFPRLKATLTALHCQQSAGPGRSRLSDAATVFDESGAVLLGPDPRLAEWLANHEWQRAFVSERHRWRHHRLLILGHAVLEKSLQPHPGMIVKVVYEPSKLPVETWLSPDSLRRLDRSLAQRWRRLEFPTPARLFPIPVLGVPGMDPDNERAGYYDNAEVFRPLPGKRATRLSQKFSPDP